MFSKLARVQGRCCLCSTPFTLTSPAGQGLPRITFPTPVESTQVSSWPCSGLCPAHPLNVNAALPACPMEEAALGQGDRASCICWGRALLSLISLFHFALHEIFNCLVERGWQLTIALFRLTELIMLCS